MFTGILGKSELQRSCLGKSGRPRNERTVLEEATTMMMMRWIFEHQKTTSYIGRIENERGMLDTWVIASNRKKHTDRAIRSVPCSYSVSKGWRRDCSVV